MLRNYIIIAWRNLIRQRVYSTINIAGLTLGLACFIVILLYVRDEMNYDQFHEKAEQVYRVVNSGDTHTPSALGPALKEDFPEVLEYVRFRTPSGVWMMRHENKVFFETRVFWIDETAFDVFTFDFLRGDPRTALEDAYSVAISANVARKIFGDEDPLGKIIRADDQFPLKVTGVFRDMPAQSHFHVDFLVPMKGRNVFYDRDVLNRWIGDTRIYTYILLRPGTSVEELARKLPAFVERRAGDQLRQEGIALEPVLQPITSLHLHSHLEHELENNSDISYVASLSAIALFILLIACINFTNLATARSIQRAREVGIRKAMSATRGQLIIQFLGESILLTLTSCCLSVVLIKQILPIINGFTQKDLSLNLLDDLSLFGLLFLVALLTGLVAGAYPAFLLSAFQPASVLKGPLRAGGAIGRFRKTLILFQFVLSTIMIISTGVVHSQLRFIQDRYLGFDQEQVVVLPFSVEVLLKRLEVFKKELQQRASVQAVSQSNTLPGRSGGKGELWLGAIHPEGFGESEKMEIRILSADYEFAETLGLELVAGRWFSRDFSSDPEQAVLINEAAVRRFGWGTPEESIGRTIDHLSQFYKSHTFRVIGVARDFHFDSLHQPITPMMIGCLGGVYLSIRLAPDAIRTGLDEIRTCWEKVYPEYPFRYSFLDEDFARLYQAEQRMFGLFTCFALITLFVACLGLFGLTAYTTEKRTKEIGIRKVLGASVTDIIFLLSKDFIILVVAANLFAWPVAYFAMQRWLQGFAYRIDLGIGIFLVGGIATLGIAWLTVGWQAVHAATVNPVKAIRYE